MYVVTQIEEIKRGEGENTFSSNINNYKFMQKKKLIGINKRFQRSISICYAILKIVFFISLTIILTSHKLLWYFFSLLLLLMLVMLCWHSSFFIFGSWYYYYNTFHYFDFPSANSQTWSQSDPHTTITSENGNGVDNVWVGKVQQRTCIRPFM